MDLMNKVVLLLCCLLLSLSRAIRDNRSCCEKIQLVHLNENNEYMPRNYPPEVADGDHTVTFECRMSCTDPDARYQPQLKVVNTEDGDSYVSQTEAKGLYNFNFKRNTTLFEGCIVNANVANNVTHHEEIIFTISVTVISVKFNRSIAFCGVHYLPSDESQCTYSPCYSSSFVLITLQNNETSDPPPDPMTGECCPCNNTSDDAPDKSNHTTEIDVSTTNNDRSNQISTTVTEGNPPVTDQSTLSNKEATSIITVLVFVVVTLGVAVLVLIFLLIKARSFNDRRSVLKSVKDATTFTVENESVTTTLSGPDDNKKDTDKKKDEKNVIPFPLPGQVENS